MSSYSLINSIGRRNPTTMPETLVIVPIIVAMGRSFSLNQFVVTKVGELIIHGVEAAMIN